MESVTLPSANSKHGYGHFQMPLHYPRYTQADYEKMPEWKLDCLLKEYGLPIIGDIHQNLRIYNKKQLSCLQLFIMDSKSVLNFFCIASVYLLS
ncbi:hypothetical protein L6164_003988 [Bauhinia variegata]|uniref:Uncharacterized protein n=1 Tax=Bauhinia variegata TaxID=167791 RepID=A0ACB9Q4J1_BAUVA|nr:hypothetical protein L6164_003988 [Bauhinia variegata]